ncbi:MAG: hypothetical protein MSS71_07125 [Campylobacter sp.]|nr:hypothetical protein [Campylobacter sp.]
MERECVYDVFRSREVHIELAPYFECEPDELSQESVDYIKARVDEYLAKLEQEKLYRAVLNKCGDDFIDSMSELYNIYNSSWVRFGQCMGKAHCSETNTFFDSYRNEINEIVFEFDDIRGEHYMASRIGTDYLVSEQKAKNTATWFAFEYVAKAIMEIELDPDKIEFISKEKQE